MDTYRLPKLFFIAILIHSYISNFLVSHVHYLTKQMGFKFLARTAEEDIYNIYLCVCFGYVTVAETVLALLVG